MENRRTRALVLLAGNGAALASSAHWLLDHSVRLTHLEPAAHAAVQVFAVIIPLAGVVTAYLALLKVDSDRDHSTWEGVSCLVFLTFMALVTYSYLDEVAEVAAAATAAESAARPAPPASVP